MNPKIEQALSLLTGCPASDFAELAILAADQAGLSEDDQTELRGKLLCSICERSIGNYEPTAKDAKLSPAAGLCEECHTDATRVVRRDLARERREEYGDGMRDAQKDAR